MVQRFFFATYRIVRAALIVCATWKGSIQTTIPVGGAFHCVAVDILKLQYCTSNNERKLLCGCIYRLSY